MDITLAKSLGKGDTVRILVMPYQPSCSILIDDALMAEIAAVAVG